MPAFPKALSGVLDQMGQSVRGLDRVQYKAGLDLSQKIWDGGMSGAGRRLKRAQNDVRQSSLDVVLRQRVESVYFAILLTEEQIALSETSRTLLQGNLEKLRSMLRNGVAMQSDVDMVEAQMLGLNQTIVQAQSAAEGYLRVLELFVGQSLDGAKLLRPAADVPDVKVCNRPELRLFESRVAANRAADRLSDVVLLPSVGCTSTPDYHYRRPLASVCRHRRFCRLSISARRAHIQ